MTIAIYLHFPAKKYLKAEPCFLFTLFSILANRHPEHEFVCFTEMDPQAALSHPLKPIVVPSPVQPFFSRWKRKIQLPRRIMKSKPNLILNCNGVDYARAAVPQYLLITDEWFAATDFLAQQKKHQRYKKKLLATLKIMAQVMVQSQFAKNELVRLYNIPAEKIAVVPCVIPAFFKPLRYEEREMVKHAFTKGVDYFLYAGNPLCQTDIVLLLKAFSHFKKWQKSSLQLLLVYRTEDESHFVESSLQNYKYKSDVMVLFALSDKELAQLTAASYAVIYSLLHPCIVTPIAEAMQCGVPVIANRKTVAPEILGEAALYVDTTNAEETGRQMIEIYRNEQKRNQLIGEGLKNKNQLDSDEMAHSIWQCIAKG